MKSCYSNKKLIVSQTHCFCVLINPVDAKPPPTCTASAKKEISSSNLFLMPLEEPREKQLVLCSMKSCSVFTIS